MPSYLGANFQSRSSNPILHAVVKYLNAVHSLSVHWSHAPSIFSWRLTLLALTLRTCTNMFPRPVGLIGVHQAVYVSARASAVHAMIIIRRSVQSDVYILVCVDMLRPILDSDYTDRGAFNQSANSWDCTYITFLYVEPVHMYIGLGRNKCTRDYIFLHCCIVALGLYFVFSAKHKNIYRSMRIYRSNWLVEPLAWTIGVWGYLGSVARTKQIRFTMSASS